MPQNTSGSVSMTLADAATPGLRFKLKTDGEYELAVATEPGDAVAQNTGAIGDEVAGELIGPGKTLKMVANEAITLGEDVYAAAAGKIQDLPTSTGTYYKIGKALQAASGDGSIIEVLPNAGTTVAVAVA